MRCLILQGISCDSPPHFTRELRKIILVILALLKIKGILKKAMDREADIYRFDMHKKTRDNSEV